MMQHERRARRYRKSTNNARGNESIRYTKYQIFKLFKEICFLKFPFLSLSLSEENHPHSKVNNQITSIIHAKFSAYLFHENDSVPLSHRLMKFLTHNALRLINPQEHLEPLNDKVSERWRGKERRGWMEGVEGGWRRTMKGDVSL